MITEEIVRQTASEGMPALKELFEKLSKEDALKGLGILAIIGITANAFATIVKLVTNK